MPTFPISQIFVTFTKGGVGLKCHYKIILVCTYVLAQEHEMHRQVTRPTLFQDYIPHSIPNLGVASLSNFSREAGHTQIRPSHIRYCIPPSVFPDPFNHSKCLSAGGALNPGLWIEGSREETSYTQGLKIEYY